MEKFYWSYDKPTYGISSKYQQCNNLNEIPTNAMDIYIVNINNLIKIINLSRFSNLVSLLIYDNINVKQVIINKNYPTKILDKIHCKCCNNKKFFIAKYNQIICCNCYLVN